MVTLIFYYTMTAASGLQPIPLPSLLQYPLLLQDQDVRHQLVF